LKEKTYVVNNRLGLHARPASLFVKTTGRFQCSIKVSKGSQEVDGKSIMGLLMLAAGPGSELKIVADGMEEDDLFLALDELFIRRFDDEDK